MKRDSLKAASVFVAALVSSLAGLAKGQCLVSPQCRHCRFELFFPEDACTYFSFCYFGQYMKYTCKEGQIFSQITLRCKSRAVATDRDCPLVPIEAVPCGRAKNRAIASSIIGGKDAAENQWPWQVSLREEGYGHICGATVIDRSWLITAAHCVHRSRPQDLTVLMGTNNKQGLSRTQVTERIISYFEHPAFNENSSEPIYPDDIALLKLSVPLQRFTTSIRKVCLPHPRDVFTGANQCVITGWGETKSFVSPNLLQELYVSIRNPRDCQGAWGNFVSNRQLCINNGLTGACYGDSGGPLVCKRGDSWNLAGVASWGANGCNVPNFPNVYTNVVDYLPWIRETMRRNP